MNGAFNGKAVTRPGAEIAEAGEAVDLLVIDGDEYRVVLFGAGAPPGEAIFETGRAVVVDGGGIGEDVVVDCGDLFEVGLGGIANVHGGSR